MLSVRSKVSALWLVGGMALLSGSLRFAFWASNEITLWYLYGAATVKHDHLKILRVKPLTASNGDVLRGIGAFHYFVGIGIWLPLAFSLAYLIDRLVCLNRVGRFCAGVISPKITPALSHSSSYYRWSF